MSVGIRRSRLLTSDMELGGRYKKICPTTPLPSKGSAPSCNPHEPGDVGLEIFHRSKVGYVVSLGQGLLCRVSTFHVPVGSEVNQ